MKTIKKYKGIIFSVLAIMLAMVMLTGCSSPSNMQAGNEQTSYGSNGQEDVSEDVVKDDGTTGSASDEYTKPAGVAFADFVTKDLDGNEVTAAIFSEKDYTMINFWGTYCGPCVAEMPEIEKIYEALPDNIGIVGIVIDLVNGAENEKTKEEADLIVETTGVKYTNLRVWEDAYYLLSEFSSFIPTTIFVDKEGNVVGEPIISADVKAYESRIAHLSELAKNGK